MHPKETKGQKWFSMFPRKIITILGVGIGILLLTIGAVNTGESETDKTEYTIRYYTEELEERIRELCTSINGVSEATVLLTLENGTEYVYAQNQESDGRAWDYVIVSSNEGEEAVLVTEIFPQVRGVAVVCTGGNTALVQQTIVKLLSASLGVPSNRIHVAGN